MGKRMRKFMKSLKFEEKETSKPSQSHSSRSLYDTCLTWAGGLFLGAAAVMGVAAALGVVEPDVSSFVNAVGGLSETLTIEASPIAPTSGSEGWLLIPASSMTIFWRILVPLPE